MSHNPRVASGPTPKVTAEQVRQWYADVNGDVSYVPAQLFEAAAHYVNLNGYEIDTEVDRIALGALDVLRLAYDGEFAARGINRTCNKFHESDD
jgi:hypothetical protein